MFVVSIFWSVMADVFSTAQSKRLFGFIGAGGTIGGITGAAITSRLVGPLGAANLLLVSAVLLEVAALAARRLFATPRTDDEDVRRVRRARGRHRRVDVGRHAPSGHRSLPA